MEPLQLVVADKQAVTVGTVRLRLTRADGGPLPGTEPGAHIALELEGRVRHYSLLRCEVAPRDYEIGVLRAASSRGGSLFIHDRLAVGDRVRALDVANDFGLDLDAPHTLLIGGGIGITPLLSMAERLRIEGWRFELHQIVRSATRQWPVPASLPAFVHIGRTGLDLRRLLAEQPPGSHAYVCGPAGLIGAVRSAAADLGWAASRVHAESFGASHDARDAPLRVTLAQSRLTLEIAPGTSLLDALLAEGVWTGHECRRGVCGACLTGVVCGRPIHRDSLAAHLRAGAICTCVSWAEGPELTLDL